MNGVSSPATMSSNSSVSGGGDDEDNAAEPGAAEKHRKFRKKRLGRPPKDKDSPARLVPFTCESVGFNFIYSTVKIGYSDDKVGEMAKMPLFFIICL